MSAVLEEPTQVEEILSVRAGPRPDPIPRGPAVIWTRHAGWVTALVTVSLAGLILDTHALGLVACGAAIFAVCSHAAKGRARSLCHAVHQCCGLLGLAIFHGADVAGSFAIPVGLLLVAALGARTAAQSIRPVVAPLAGPVPWRFRAIYRNYALWFASAGLAAGLGLVAFAPSALVKVVGVAMLPLALRTYAGNLLSHHASWRLWALAVSVHVAALAAFVPSHGAMAAAWAMVGSETLLFLGSAAVIARRTGVSPFPTLHMAGLAGAAILLCALTVPSSSEWPFLVAILFGTGCGAILFPKKTP